MPSGIATDVTILPGTHLEGATTIHTGAVNDEVVIAIGGGHELVAIVTHDSVEKLGLAVGEQACAVFKASAVILCLYA